MSLPLSGLTTLLAAAAVPFASAAAAQDSLCPPGDKVWYEAEMVDADMRIAVCSRPAAGEDVGRIAAYSGNKITGGSQRTLLAEAAGKDRAKSFVLRRYTRPHTTYLKFEFKAKDGRSVAIYDDFVAGEGDTRVAISANAGPSEPAAAVHVAPSEPLSIMTLEPVVSVQPYDE